MIIKTCLTCIILAIQSIAVNSFNGTPDYKNHPCNRPCNNNTKPMICEYDWRIEWYSVLSKACLDCPFNLTSCGNKDCVAANGIKRPIITVNRMLPGPTLNVCQGDQIKVFLYNGLHMAEGTSIHW